MQLKILYPNHELLHVDYFRQIIIDGFSCITSKNVRWRRLIRGTVYKCSHEHSSGMTFPTLTQTDILHQGRKKMLMGLRLVDL